MINVNQSYINACESNERKGYVVARLGESDPKIKSSIFSIMTALDKPSFSVLSKLYDNDTQENSNYISCERNRVKLDGSFKFIKDKNSSSNLENIAYWNKYLSNANGEFEYSERLIIRLDTAYPFTELTLYFADICERFKVNYFIRDYNGNLTLKATRFVENNNSLVVSTSGNNVSEDITFNYISIEFFKTKEPYRYIKLNEIDFGGLLTFQKEQIENIDIINEISVNNNELPAKSLNLTINDFNNEFDILNPKSNSINILEKVKSIKIDYYLLVANNYQSITLGTYLLENYKIENQKLKFDCYDTIYYLNEIYYGSNFYDGVEVKQIFNDLFNYFNYTNYEINISDNDNIKLMGYIPNVEFREALRIIAEASGLCVTTNRYGKIVIKKLFVGSTSIYEKPKTFDRRLFFKENVKVEKPFSINFTLYDYNYNTNNIEEIYNQELDIGTHLIELDKLVLPNTIQKMETNSNYDIINQYALNCVVKVTQLTTVKLKASIINEKKTSYIYNKKYVNDNCINIDNTLINTNNVDSVAYSKRSSGKIIYNFDTLLMPYIEEGDNGIFVTKYNQNKPFTITKIEFSNSIIQNIEGE